MEIRALGLMPEQTLRQCMRSQGQQGRGLREQAVQPRALPEHPKHGAE